MPNSPLQLPLGFENWPPLAQGFIIAALTLVNEDATTLGAAFLVLNSVISRATGFLGAYLGIWLGDAMLYWFARGVGRPLAERRWMRRWIPQRALARSEAWFHKHGSWAILISRLVPGTRLPTYMAAGFLRVPFGLFLLITGVAAFVWTVIVFALAEQLGEPFLRWMEHWQISPWLWPLMIVVLWGLLWLGHRLFATETLTRALEAIVERTRRWEFWPAWLYYPPIVANYILLSLRHGFAFTLPSAANPGIAYGGFIGEEKFPILETLQRTNPELTARAWKLDQPVPAARLETLRALLDAGELSLPFILKPDQGQRGVGVKRVDRIGQAQEYLESEKRTLIAQRYVAGPFEAGVFYCRDPREAHGRITAITEKIFPELTGDGVHTIEELIRDDDRAQWIAATYLRRFAARRGEVLPAGERLRLVEAGNHAQGCLFRDGARLHTAELERAVDGVARRFPGFFAGRFDVRYASEDEFKAGRGFQILELNGASSEATNAYDARFSVLQSYAIQFRHWRAIFAIAAENRRRGTRPATMRECVDGWFRQLDRAKTQPAAD